jgi:hypothetical protein
MMQNAFKMYRKLKKQEKIKVTNDVGYFLAISGEMTQRYEYTLCKKNKAVDSRNYKLLPSFFYQFSYHFD